MWPCQMCDIVECCQCCADTCQGCCQECARCAKDCQGCAPTYTGYVAAEPDVPTPKDMNRDAPISF